MNHKWVIHVILCKSQCTTKDNLGISHLMVCPIMSKVSSHRPSIILPKHYQTWFFWSNELNERGIAVCRAMTKSFTGTSRKASSCKLVLSF